MSKKKIDDVKGDKWFRIWDLIVYGVIVLIIASLFLAVFLTADKTPTDGIKINYNGRTVFNYYYAEDKYEIVSQNNIVIEQDTDERLLLTFYTDGKTGYNKIEIDKKVRSVCVADADCSSHKDCVYSPPIKNNSTVISCPPHNMRIEPLVVKVEDDDIIIIG
ncbi:MAG: hypothetical protein ACI4MS_07245 [Candidatus Coproplasma sp.]